MDHYYPPSSYGLVICNGVLGWGVNDEASIAAAAEQLATVLKPGGWLVLGWNDMDGYRPATLAPFDASPFARFTLPPIGADTHLTPTGSRHTFRFFRKGENESMTP